MTDYDKATGSTGTMRIRDTGTVVEFWITSGNGTTYTSSMDWGFTVNGNTDNTNTYNYTAGNTWRKLASWTVSTSQTVTFRLYDTGTSGLGGPTTHSVAITRTFVPSPPSVVTISAITPTSVYGVFTDGANGGLTITNRQIAYGTSPTTPQYSVVSDKSTTISGLSPGTKYYFWARTYNSKGWSSYGPRSEATTIAGVRINVTGTWKIAVPYVKAAGVWKLAVPWVRAAGVWKEAK